MIYTKNIDKIIRQLKQVKQNKPQYTAAQTLAWGLSDGSIQWGDDRFTELISGDLMRIIEKGGTDG